MEHPPKMIRSSAKDWLTPSLTRFSLSNLLRIKERRETTPIISYLSRLRLMMLDSSSWCPRQSRKVSLTQRFIEAKRIMQVWLGKMMISWKRRCLMVRWDLSRHQVIWDKPRGWIIIRKSVDRTLKLVTADTVTPASSSMIVPITNLAINWTKNMNRLKKGGSDCLRVVVIPMTLERMRTANQKKMHMRSNLMKMLLMEMKLTHRISPMAASSAVMNSIHQFKRLAGTTSVKNAHSETSNQTKTVISATSPRMEYSTKPKN